MYDRALAASPKVAAGQTHGEEALAEHSVAVHHTAVLRTPALSGAIREADRAQHRSQNRRQFMRIFAEGRQARTGARQPMQARFCRQVWNAVWPSGR